MPLEKDLPASRVTVARRAGLENASLDEILHQAKDQSITSLRCHDIDGDWQNLLVESDVGIVRS